MKILKRRPFTLLEVLIGFLLILIALVPLFAPYPYMFKRQEEMFRELEMDRLASIYYVNLLQKILTKEIDPEQLKKGDIRKVDTLPEEADFPYKAIYVFNEDQVSIVFSPKRETDPLNQDAIHEFTYAL